MPWSSYIPHNCSFVCQCLHSEGLLSGFYVSNFNCSNGTLSLGASFYVETSIEIVLLILCAVTEQYWGWTLKYSWVGGMEEALAKSCCPDYTKGTREHMYIFSHSHHTVIFSWDHFSGYACYLVVSLLKESILRDGLDSREKDLRIIFSCIYFYETAEKMWNS